METNKKGFTLIELLVVIAIIAILAAILFPIFISVKEHTKVTGCISNLNQLGRAMRIYSDDWNGCLPSSYHASDPKLNWSGTLTRRYCNPRVGQLWRYVKNMGVYACPSDNNVPAKTFEGTLEQQKKYALSYAMNTLLSYCNLDTLQRPGSTKTVHNTRLTKMCLLIHEGRENIGNGDFHPWGSRESVTGIHYDGTCILFADMHGRWYSKNELLRALDNGEWDPSSIVR